MARIQVLFFSGCLHAPATVDLVRRAAIACGLSDERTNVTLACRLYGTSGVPASELIVDAIRNFRT